MRKLLSTFTLALLAAASAWAQIFTVDNLKYKVTDATTQTVELTGYETEPTGALTIPAIISYNGTEYSVTSIGNWAFSSCFALTQVNIPDDASEHTRRRDKHWRLCVQLLRRTHCHQCGKRQYDLLLRKRHIVQQKQNHADTISRQ